MVDIGRLDRIRKELNQLLNRRTNVLLEEMPIELSDSVRLFITGRTMVLSNGKPAMLYGDYIDFYNYLWRK